MLLPFGEREGERVTYPPEPRPSWQQKYPSLPPWLADAQRRQDQIDDSIAVADYMAKRAPEPEHPRPARTAIAVRIHTPWWFIARGRAIVSIDGERVLRTGLVRDEIVQVSPGVHVVDASYRIFPQVVRGIGHCSQQVHVLPLHTVGISYDVRVRASRFLLLPFALLIPRLVYKATLNVTTVS